MSTLSLVVICRDHEEFLRKSLESIERQHLLPRQVILVDVASTDGSPKILDDWSRDFGPAATLIALQRDQSIVEVIQMVEPMLSEPLVSFLSADDFSSAERFDVQVKALSQTPSSVAVCFTDAVAVDYTGRRLRIMRSFPDIGSSEIIEASDMMNMLVRKNWIIAPSVMMKTNLVRRFIAELDPTMPFEDYPLWLSISKSHDFLYIPQPLVAYRFHAGNTSGKTSAKLEFTRFEVSLLSSILDAEPQRARHIRRGALGLLWRSIKLRDISGARRALTLAKATFSGD